MTRQPLVGTCSVDGGSLQGEVFDQDGCSLVDKNIHTLHVALKCS